MHFFRFTERTEKNLENENMLSETIMTILTITAYQARNDLTITFHFISKMNKKKTENCSMKNCYQKEKK